MYFLTDQLDAGADRGQRQVPDEAPDYEAFHGFEGINVGDQDNHAAVGANLSERRSASGRELSEARLVLKFETDSGSRTAATPTGPEQEGERPERSLQEVPDIHEADQDLELLSDPRPQISCRHCTLQFHTQDDFLHHENLEHRDEIRRTWPLCPGCLWHFPTQRCLKLHQCSETTRSIRCPFCHTVFRAGAYEDYVSHANANHIKFLPGCRWQPCQWCFKFFPNDGLLQKHLQTPGRCKSHPSGPSGANNDPEEILIDDEDDGQPRGPKM